LSYGVLRCHSHSVRALHVKRVSEQDTPHTYMQHTLT